MFGTRVTGYFRFIFTPVDSPTSVLSCSLFFDKILANPRRIVNPNSGKTRVKVMQRLSGYFCVWVRGMIFSSGFSTVGRDSPGTAARWCPVSTGRLRTRGARQPREATRGCTSANARSSRAPGHPLPVRFSRRGRQGEGRVGENAPGIRAAPPV